MKPTTPTRWFGLLAAGVALLWPAIVLAQDTPPGKPKKSGGLLGTLNGVRRGMRLKPAESMRPPAPRSGKRILLERWTSFWRLLDIQWQMVLRDLMRRKGRTEKIL